MSPDNEQPQSSDDVGSTEAARRIVATLHTSAATLPPSPPSARRIQRLRELTRRDPTWAQDD